MGTEDRPKLRRPSRRRLVDDVSRSIEEAILSGDARPGERLIEATISNDLGVSRSTVREALLMLERRGLVVNRPRRGTFVTRLSTDEATDIRVARALLEGFAVRAGHARIDDSLVAELADVLDEMRGCDLPKELSRAVRLDLTFHRRLMERVGSPRLVELWASLNGQIGALMLQTVERKRAGRADLVALHEELLDAIRTREPQTIEAAVIDHYIGPGQTDGQAIPALVEVLTSVSERIGDE